jgi:hypothetical protein
MVALIGATVTFSLSKGWIDGDTAVYLSSILAAVAAYVGVSNYVSFKKSK